MQAAISVPPFLWVLLPQLLSTLLKNSNCAFKTSLTGKNIHATTILNLYPSFVDCRELGILKTQEDGTQADHQPLVASSSLITSRTVRFPFPAYCI